MTDLVVTPAVATIRRRLGPVAWVVLEELLLGAGPADGTAGTTRSCDATVRDLAERLGLDKDTVARAVRRLADDGLIAREQARTVDGTFTRTTYRVDGPRRPPHRPERTHRASAAAPDGPPRRRPPPLAQPPLRRPCSSPSSTADPRWKRIAPRRTA